MPIDLTSPTIRPPSALDLAQPTGEAAEPLSAPVSGVPTLPAPNITPYGDVSRYDADVVRQASEVIDRDITRAQRDAGVALAEHHAARGTTGSSIESWSQQEMLTNLETERMRRLSDLEREMANTYATDRATAANIGMDISRFQEGQRQFGMGFGLQERAQQLTALGMDRDEAYRFALMEQQGGQFGAQLAQRESEFARTYGLSGQSLQLEAQRLMQQAQLEGRSLDIQQALGEAELGLRAQQLVQQAQLEGRSLDIEEARLQAQNEQFDMQMDFQRQQLMIQTGLDQQSLDLQREQFVAEYADRAADRVFRMGLQESDQEFQAEQARQDRLLESQALELQRAGLDAEVAWREADRMLTEQLETRALELQATGIALEDAYRRASLEFDYQRMQQTAEIQNQQAQLSQWDIYLRALAGGASTYLPEGENLLLPGLPGSQLPITQVGYGGYDSGYYGSGYIPPTTYGPGIDAGGLLPPPDPTGGDAITYDPTGGTSTGLYGGSFLYPYGSY